MKFTKKDKDLVEVKQGDFVVLDGKLHIIVRRGKNCGDYTIVDLKDGEIISKHSHPLLSKLQEELIHNYKNVYFIPTDNIEINEV